MAKHPAPTVISYFRTGLYTHRSQLFAPIRSMGINVIQMKDALIDGQDMEVTDLLEVQRRPGFTRYCSQQLAGGEIINQFGETGDGSIRLPSGTVVPVFDSNQRVAKFDTTSITSLWTKPSADQAFLKSIGTQIYMANGTTDGQKRYDTATNTLHANGIVGPAAAPTLAPPATANTTFWQPNVSYPARAVLMDYNGNIQADNTGTPISGANTPAWSTTFSSGTQDGTGTWQNLGPPATWQPNYLYRFDIAPRFIVDNNGNMQEATVSGTSGAAVPVFATTIGNTAADNTVTWTCRGKGSQSVFAGYVYVYVYSTQAPTVTTGYYHCSTASPATITTGPVFGPYSYVLSGAFSTNTDVTSVDIYRTKDGGSVLYYCGSVANNSAGGTWTFTDAVNDTALLTQTAVPLQGVHRNDVMPGMTGSIAPSTDKAGYLEYWNGRMWTIAGNKVYFSAGPDCQNGDPNASWPPANVFSYPGQPIALTPTSAGLLVWLNNSCKIIAGGPQTLTFFTVDLLQSFGISSPNCVDKDGDTIRVISTQGQQWTLTVSDRVEDGHFVADLIAGFAPQSSYLTTHRNGLDSGVFIGNGSETLLRYGLNIGAWSTQYKPVGGIKALRSMETTVGHYSLLAGRASAAGYILKRDLTTYQDDGSNYSNCFATIGNITLSEPLQDLVPVAFIAGYFAAVGSVPQLSILPNEIDSSSGIGFILIPDPTPEPPIGQAASTTLMAKRWSTSNQNTMLRSLLYHHIQVKFSFPQENFANAIKILAISPDSEV